MTDVPFEPRFKPMEWLGDRLRLLDQRALPNVETYIDYTRFEGVAASITDMVVRGAPAIGITAAFGVALAARQVHEGTTLSEGLEPAFTALAATRPTAVNLFWALDRMRKVVDAVAGQSRAEAIASLDAAALAIHHEDYAMCRAMGDHGAPLLPKGARVLTHCNAGALATGGYGTALGLLRSAFRDGRLASVYADETRPYLQGARLTAWELHKDGIPVTVITDNMAGHMMSRGHVDAVVVGTDRIAANGDVANKIGTFTLAVLCDAMNIPFIVVGPTSTVDMQTADGSGIPIEQRPDLEVTHVGDRRLVPIGVPVANPAFDVTPARLVTAIVTEKGIARPPYGPALAAMMNA